MVKKELNYSQSTAHVKELVQIGLLSAIAYIGAMILHIPYGNGGVVHLGDTVIFLAAILFGSRQAALSGAIGLTLFDITSGYMIWAPYTLVIKTGMGLITGIIAQSGKSKGNNFGKNILGMVLGGIWMIAGYYVAESIIAGNMKTPILSIPGNVIQFAGSLIISVVLVIALKKTRYFNK